MFKHRGCYAYFFSLSHIVRTVSSRFNGTFATTCNSIENRQAYIN